MKSIFLLLLFSLSVFSQEKTPGLRITYEKLASVLGQSMKEEHKLYIAGGIEAKYEIKANAKKIREGSLSIEVPAQHILIYSNQEKIAMNKMLDDNETVVYAEWGADDIEWEITGEEKQMAGYRVIKATTDAFHVDKDSQFYPGKAIAWFAPELPYPFGPMGYNGLPGLIIYLTFEKNSESYSTRYLDKVENITFPELNKKHKVDKETIFKIPAEIFDAIEKK